MRGYICTGASSHAAAWLLLKRVEIPSRLVMARTHVALGHALYLYTAALSTGSSRYDLILASLMHMFSMISSVCQAYKQFWSLLL